jgi:TetR/AcrR family transcriptional repressor of nem operon
MPPSKAHTARSRQAILDGAGRLFRARGYEATSIDDVTAAAGLTRGTFYAHFKSKEALLAEVLRANYGLIRMMRGRKARDPWGLRRETWRVLRDYLAPAHIAEVGPGCTLAALSGDAARAGPEARAAYSETLAALIQEFERSMPRPGPAGDRAALAVIISVGAVTLARACADQPARSGRLLRAAGRAMAAELAPLKPPSSPARRRRG